MAMPSMQDRAGMGPAASLLASEPALGVPRIMLAGEANSGKTTLVNVLLQTQLLVTDIVSSTPCPMLLRFGETAHLRVLRKDGTAAVRSLGDLRDLARAAARFVEVYLPSQVLQRMEILDLPGFASQADAEGCARWAGAADILVWCTAATQAWKASEQAMWRALGRGRDGSFLVLTHRDLLSEKQLGEVTERVARETERFFAQMTAIAAPQAVAARHPRGGGTGLTDFTEKLHGLLQAASAPRGEAAPSSRQQPAVTTTPEREQPALTEKLHELLQASPPRGEAVPAPQQQQATAAPESEPAAVTGKLHELLQASPPRGEAASTPQQQPVATATSEREPPAATGKLRELLQASAPRGEAVPAPQQPATAVPAPEQQTAAKTAPDIEHPVAALGALRERILLAVGGDRSTQESAAIMAREFEVYGREMLTPWLTANRWARGAKAIEGLLPVDADEIAACLTPEPGDPAVFTPARILAQIEAELAEALHVAAGRA